MTRMNVFDSKSFVFHNLNELFVTPTSALNLRFLPPSRLTVNCLLYSLLKVTKDNLDAVLQQQIMDQFRKDNEALLGHLEQRKLKSLEDTKVLKISSSTVLTNQ